LGYYGDIGFGISIFPANGRGQSMKTVENMKDLYEKDYFTWTREMSRALAEQRTRQ
jgi:hypothetical protein